MTVQGIHVSYCNMYIVSSLTHIFPGSIQHSYTHAFNMNIFLWCGNLDVVASSTQATPTHHALNFSCLILTHYPLHLIITRITRDLRMKFKSTSLYVYTKLLVQSLTLSMVSKMVPAAPAAVNRASMLGPAWPRAKAPISTAKNTWNRYMYM